MTGTVRVWVAEDGTWTVADAGGWLPGIYADEAAARAAVDAPYLALAAAVDPDRRGHGSDYRPVTLADVQALGETS